MASERRGRHRRNEKLEGLLGEINGLLNPIDSEATAGFNRPAYPTVFVLGLPRSGSTLMMQCLATSGSYAYPTNLLSRFYAAPYVGAKIQRLLTDPAYNFNDEILDFSGEIDFASVLGKTKGALAPNEFWYFWRRFTPNVEPRLLSPEELERVDTAGLCRGIAAIEAALGRPFALKALILALNADYLASALPRAVFVVLNRDPFFNIQSLLKAREDYFGDRSGWYSIKPPEYEQLADQEPIEQVCGQVHFSSIAMRAGLKRIDKRRIIEVDYRSLCEQPRVVFERLGIAVASLGYGGPVGYSGPERFEHSDQVRLTESDAQRVRSAWRSVSGRESPGSGC